MGLTVTRQHLLYFHYNTVTGDCKRDMEVGIRKPAVGSKR